MLSRTTAWRRAAAVLIALAAAGCSTSTQQDAASDVARQFIGQVTSSPAKACALLAPQTREELQEQAEAPCDKALPELELPASGAVQSVEVAGHSAQVRTAGQTLFLALFDQGWRVTAAGCQRTEADPARPYSCLLKGA